MVPSKVDTGGFELGRLYINVEMGQAREFTEDKLDLRPKTFHIQSNRDIKTFKAYYLSAIRR